jgi:hypothetical protein
MQRTGCQCFIGKPVPFPGNTAIEEDFGASEEQAAFLTMNILPDDYAPPIGEGSEARDERFSFVMGVRL